MDSRACECIQDGYSEWNGSCLPCQSSSGSATMLMLAKIFGMAALTHVLAQGSSETMEMLFFTIQSTALIFYPNIQLLTLDRLLNYFPPVFGGLSGSCPFAIDGLGELGVRLVSPLISLGFLWFLYLMQRGVVVGLRQLSTVRRLRCLQRSGPRKAMEWLERTGLKNNFIMSSIVLGIGSFDGFAETTLQFFTCTSVGPQSYMLFMPSVQCYTPMLRGWMSRNWHFVLLVFVCC